MQRCGGIGAVVASTLRQALGSQRWRRGRASWSSNVVASGLRWAVHGPNLPAPRQILTGRFVTAQVRLSRCSRRKPWRFTVVGYNCGLTIHSSRTRFVASFKCVVVPLQPLTDQQVAGRLNSSVRRLGTAMFAASWLFVLCGFGGLFVPGACSVAALRAVPV